ncbi:hypothetical protein T439DRAFT_328520 [Meredithblackwellia eburnea MCA 4105]
MFKRPFTSKTTTPVRSSDLRKFRDEVVATFELSPSSVKTLLPDGTQTTKITTHLDEPCTLYSGPSSDPLFFRIGKGTDGPVVPTLYAFDQYPGDLLPVLVTAPQVVEHLVSGSALFLAGVSDQSLQDLPDLEEGALVAVSAIGSPAIVAVGQLGADKKELLKATDKKGKAVITLHARGDYLYKSGSESESGPVPPPSGSGDELAEDVSKLELEPKSKGNGKKASKGESSRKDEAQGAPVETTGEVSAESMSPADVDQMFKTALLLSIKQTLSKSPSLFPMPASSLFSAHILPNRPAHLSGIDIKKSSWKKLAPFIKAVAKLGWVTAKEVKGELVVMSVNGTHADVEAVRSYKTIAQGSSSSPSDSPTTNITTGGSSSSNSSAADVVVRELFKPPSAFRGILPDEVEQPDHDLYTSAQLKSALLSYVTSHSISHPRDQKFIQLSPDDALTSVLLKKGEDLDVMSKDEALKRLKEAGTKFWELRKGKEDPVVKKGTPPLVKIAIKTVGKRQVTLISNFEQWGLFTAEEVAEDLRHRAASSTAVQPIHGSSPKKPLFEIMVQGSHESLVTQVLAARGLPKQYVEVDLSKLKR